MVRYCLADLDKLYNIVCYNFPPPQILVVYPIPNDDDYVMGDYKGSKGKVLATYIEKL